MSHEFAMAVATTIVVGVNALWYAAKIFLHKRGVSVSWFSRHFEDLTSLRELADRAPNQADRPRAGVLLWALRWGIVAFVAVAAPLFLWGALGRHWQPP